MDRPTTNKPAIITELIKCDKCDVVVISISQPQTDNYEDYCIISRHHCVWCEDCYRTAKEIITIELKKE